MTRDRITYLIILVMLAIVAIWVARNTYWDDSLVPMPPQGEAATNAYYSVQHIAAALGIRSSFIVSPRAAPPGKAALLIDGFQGDMTHTQVDALAPWVESGGRLIITDDVVRVDPKFQVWSGIYLGAHFDYSAKSKPKTIARNPEDDCAPLDVAADGKATGQTLTLCIPPQEFGWFSKRKPAWSLANGFGLQVLRVNIGRGSVTVIPRYFLIANKNLIRHDHAEIFITASHLSRGDALYIVNVARAESLIPMLWRLAAPALVFFGVAVLCIILREWPRFGPPLPPPARVRRSLAEQIRANAAFAWRTRKLTALRAAVRRALDETAKKRIASYGSLDVRKRVSAIAAWAGTDSKTLNSAMTEDAAAAPQVQRAAITLLEQTRRILNARIKKIDQGRA
ncbi:MAG: hypothetical protein ACLPV8_27155 [Steroidobacteraceae bacterium]